MLLSPTEYFRAWHTGEYTGAASRLLRSRDGTSLEPTFVNSGVIELAHYYLIFTEYKQLRYARSRQYKNSKSALPFVEDEDDAEWMVQMQHIANRLFAIDPVVEHATQQYLTDSDENEQFLHDFL